MSSSMLNTDCELDSNSVYSGWNRSVAEGGVDDSGGGSGEIGVSSREEEEELDLGAPVDARVLGNEDVRDRVCAESDSEREGVDKVVNSRADFEGKDTSVDYGEKQFDVKVNQSDRSRAQIEVFEAENHAGVRYKSLLSEFDDYVASEKNGVGLGMSRANRFGFEVGDMVWGKVKSHPWWPGHIFNEAFATTSVRRIRREDLVLVAFFGDSSYGWFDPAELVPFDPNFTDKCQQTNSRTFVKAVEEAVDELSRRRGLGVACKCRNPFNFRPTVVKEYYAVDVPDYDPGGVYSEIQIQKARDGFHPGETLDFIKQLALTPRDSDQKNIEFVKKKATVFAYRKAVFEEFDETYAQAFGVQGVRSSRDLSASEQPIKMPRLAPFSGPLVIAETLGSGKSSVKSPKVEEHSKKDRYLFKRRDESSNTKVHQTHQGTSSSPLAAGDFVLQKRTPDLIVKPEIPAIHTGGSISTDGACSSQFVSMKAETIDQTPVHPSGHVKQYASPDRKSSLANEKAPSDIDSDLIMGSSSTSLAIPDVKDGGSLPSKQEGKVLIDLKHEVGVNVSLSREGFQQPVPSLLTKVEWGHGVDQVHDAVSGAHSLPVDVKRAAGVKKTKVKKIRMGDSGSNVSLLGEKKKKKKREFDSEPSKDHPKKRLATGKGGPCAGKLTGKSTFSGLGRKEDSLQNHQKKNDGANNSMPTSVWPMLTVGEHNVPQLLTDLQSLALVPFHGVERNSPAIIKEFFGKFRSDAFQKSQKNSVPSQATGTGGFEVQPAQPIASEDVNALVGEGAEGGGLPSKPAKVSARPNDPTKAGRKRSPSDRQEENAAKKVKRVNDLKSMAAEKKSNPKNTEAQQGEGRKTGAHPKTSARPPDARRVEPPVKAAAEPTMLVMKFPPQMSLPSVAELKARFARFGPLDHMAIRVFWKTSMCRVVFRHKRDAQNALKYASVNNSLFGNVNVRYYIREIGVEPTEGTELGKGGDTKDPATEQRSTRLHQPGQQPAVLLKSILKRSGGGGDEVGSNGGGRVGTPRVKFMLGGEETVTASSSGGEQMVAGNNNSSSSNASFADAAPTTTTNTTTTTTTTVATLDFNSSNNFQKFNPPSTSSLPLFTPTPQQPNHHHHHHRDQEFVNQEGAGGGAPGRKVFMQSTTTGGIDISEQMVTLLTRCNDVVLNLSGLLGYVPYHPL